MPTLLNMRLATTPITYARRCIFGMRLDIVLRGGLVIDGTGAPPFRGDVGISGGSIAAIGDLSGVPAERVVDVRGMVVCPGFIDIHNHSDISIFAVPTADNYVLQGVTTIVTGNCGLSPAPVTRENREFIRDSFRPYSAEITIGWRGFGEYLERLEALDKGVNVAPLVGHGTVRAAVMGLSDQRPGEDEMREMKRLVDEAMAAGAFGLSTGLVYVPGVFAATEEVAELARVSAERGGIYATHVRDEGEGLLDALAEAVAVARSSGAPLQVSHLKASGRANWGRVSAALALLEDLASRGFDVSADAYPYTAGATYLAALLPPWAREGGPREMARRLRDPGVVERLRRELAAPGTTW
ncbi:hypothetical protein B6U99_01920 [Candidatus Geothermarchaeota archaeon ex4572_27]|nr:MAG: hypothetical protein B6U99_01920 [Candidatus Geothermarchaeota archaeon ex4572_27]